MVPLRFRYILSALIVLVCVKKQSTAFGIGSSKHGLLLRHRHLGVLASSLPNDGIDANKLTGMSQPYQVKQKDLGSKSEKMNGPSSVKLVAGTTFNTVKAMLGTGILALPMGLAVITDHTEGILPASLLLTTLGALSGYTFALYGRMVHATQARSLGELWKTIGKNDKRDTSIVISLANAIFCFGCCLAYSLILGDTFSSLVQGTFVGAPSWAVSRQASILAVTAFFLFPLCRLKSLASLAPFSLVGVIGTLLTIGFLGFRCPALIPGSPYASSGVWAAKTTFGTFSRALSPAPLTLVSMSCIALMAHFSAPDFYHAMVPMKDIVPNGATAPVSVKGNHDSTLRNFLTATIASFSVVGILNCLSLAFGFLTFGANCSGNILNNYHLKDAGARLSRLLVGISLIGSYPMVVRPVQTTALELLGIKATEKNNFRMMTGLLSVLTALALALKNVGFVLSLNGSLIGTNLVYTIPSLLFLKLTKERVPTRSLRMERIICRLLVLFGLTAMVAGTGAAIISTFYPRLLS